LEYEASGRSLDSHPDNSAPFEQIPPKIEDDPDEQYPNASLWVFYAPRSQFNKFFMAYHLV
jgi:hypothetical protein